MPLLRRVKVFDSNNVPKRSLATRFGSLSLTPFFVLRRHGLQLGRFDDGHGSSIIMLVVKSSSQSAFDRLALRFSSRRDPHDHDDAAVPDPGPGLAGAVLGRG